MTRPALTPAYSCCPCSACCSLTAARALGRRQAHSPTLRSNASAEHPLWPKSFFFFFNDTATTEIYTLSLHDALPISRPDRGGRARRVRAGASRDPRALDHGERGAAADRKSTRLNSSHSQISYAVFCLKKKNI